MFSKQLLPPSRCFLLYLFIYFCYLSIGHCKVKISPCSWIWQYHWDLNLSINKCPRLPPQKNHPSLLFLLPIAYSCPPTSPCLLCGHKHVWNQEVNETEKVVQTSTLQTPHLSPQQAVLQIPFLTVSPTEPTWLLLALRKGPCRGQISKWVMRRLLGTTPNYTGLSG